MTGLHDPFALGTIVRAVPTTDSQRELWLSVRLGGDPANCAFNESVHVELTGPLDVPALERALEQVIERHDALRAVISVDGQVLYVLESVAAPLPLVDLSSESDRTQRERLAELFAREVREPFDLERGPLFRASLVRLGPEKHSFVFTAHHVVFDGWSAAVLLGDLGIAYSASRARVEPLLDPAPSFADYAVTERSVEHRAAERNAESYWLAQYEGDTPQTEFPSEGRRPELRTFDATRLDWEVDAKTVADLRALGARHGATFVATLFAAFGAYTCRVTGKTDIVIGMPSAGQAATGEHSLVGHCVNTLPVRCRFDVEQPFGAALGAVKSALLEAQEHRELGFGALVQRLHVARDPSRLPLVSVLFNLDVALSGQPFTGLEAHVAANPRAYENFEVSLNAVDYGTRLVLETTYNTNVFASGEMESRLAGFAAMLADLVARPDVPLARLDVLAPSERERIAGFVEPFIDEAVPLPVHRLFARQAALWPNVTAVAASDRSLSYDELRERALRLAHLLVVSGVKPGSRVAVCLTRRADLVVALLAILEAGAAYVPVDPAYPKRRIEMILEDATPEVLLVERATADNLPTRISGTRLDLDDALTRAAALDAAELELPSNPDALAYVIFTSGSTGRPKGVQIPHSALSNFLASMAKTPGFSPGDRLLAVTTISFDIAGLEIFLPLVAGGTVRLLPQEAALDAFALERVLETEHVDLLQATPATFRMLIDAGWRGSPKLKLLCGGEPFPVDLARALLPRCRELYNMYGPTETTVWSTLHHVETVTGSSIPIGRPIDRTRVYVLDERLQQVPLGVEGDLYIGGSGLARGYHERPDLTETVFLPDPFVPGARIYRTGDRARWLSDGTLDHLGRSDSQVKIRGFRIELGEIEAALSDFDGVREVAVLVREDTPGDKRLVAYLTHEDAVKPDAPRLREHLHDRLPRYMVPSAFVLLERMPLTPARKIDKRSLPPPVSADAHAGGGPEPPRNDDERALVTMFCELLQQKDLGRDSDFFESGGHSLLAVRLFTRIESELGVRLPLSTILVAPTAAKLAALVHGDAPSEASSSVRLLRRGVEGERGLFLVHDADGETLLYMRLARDLLPGVPVYGITPPGDTTNPLRHTRIERIASEYVKCVRAIQPKGPYAFGGLCAGGVLAFAMALELEARGEQVEFVALLDSAAPGAELKTGLIARRRIERFLGGWRNRSSPEVESEIARPVPRSNPTTSEKLLDAARKVGRLVRYEADRVSTQAINQLKFWSLRSQVFDETEIPTFSRGLTVRSIYEMAESRYEPNARLRAPALLFRATDGVDADEPSVEFYEDPLLGWSDLCRALEVIDTTGGHSSMLQPPHVREVAAHLSAQLARRSSMRS